MHLVPIIDRYKLDGAALTEASAVRDLLTDVIHYCHAHELDFARLVHDALDVAQEEEEEILAGDFPYPPDYILGGNE